MVHEWRLTLPARFTHACPEGPEENPVSAAFIHHLQHNWPLAVVIVGLLFYLPLVLIGGVFFTNQGRIHRSKEPTRFWRWVALMLGLLLACLAVLVGSYAFGTP
jgi:threonine/homoserine/homoserine lactone efflux protein